ncbi:kynureninase [Parapusillimonas granuli]|uniref:Kynureninase n=1 Tax=Parapusillimonas granuli TaxID=380911 RepID=A0A853G822_9BURK|nr:kynureninase [Parapusillimonas granuli]MBB5214359.1 kynureninase [Parapusillimonas granuli]MEB2399171.1 kynureninase [Alcaligenaceae bacterium]NYT51892.1 kynureninase [Parapusillimonas granuli]
MTTREDCLELDRKDALAGLRDEFSLPAGVIYLDGNSLGARPRAALQRAREVVEHEWGTDLIRSWNKAGWFELPLALGDKLAPLIGAGPGEAAVTDTTSINLFKALAAALHLQAADPARADRRVIVTERGNFPTDVYIAQGLAQWLGQGYQLRLVDRPEDLPAAIGADVAVVMLTHVNYRTGRLLDMAGLTRHAHDQGALMVWDLAHSAGALPVDLNASSADFAVGCTYKYLNGGPGAPAFIWVAPRYLDRFRQPLTGWWGHANPFAMQSEFVPSTTIRSALCGTQPTVSLALVECGLDVFAKTDIHSLRQKSLALTDLFIELVEQRCAAHPLELVTPREHALRGSQVSFTHPHGYAVVQSLIDKGVIGDYREPGIMRFGFTPLYIRFVDVYDAVETLARILDEGDYDLDRARDAVT